MANGGVMQFALGLSTSAFTKSLESAGAKLGAFAKNAMMLTGTGAAIEAGMQGIKGLFNVVEGVSATFEKAEGLVHLAKTTGESVRSLVLLQSGLRAVGLDAGSAGNMIFMLQRALGGVNEEGLPTGHIFQQLGMNLEDIKKLDAPMALEAIAQRLAKLDNASAASAAAKIFGRGAARDMLQLARSADEFKEAMAGAAKIAALWERNAVMLAKVQHTMEMIKAQAKGLFLGIAVGMAPAIQAVLDLVRKIDFVSIGQKIGSVFTAITEAFKKGQLGELVSLTLKVGFEEAVNFLWAAMVGVWEAIKTRAGTMFTGIPEALVHGARAFGEALQGALLTAVGAFIGALDALPDLFNKFGAIFGGSLDKALTVSLMDLAKKAARIFEILMPGMGIAAKLGEVGMDLGKEAAQRGDVDSLVAAASGDMGALEKALRQQGAAAFGRAGSEGGAALTSWLGGQGSSWKQTFESFIKGFQNAGKVFSGEDLAKLKTLYNSLLTGAPVPPGLKLNGKGGEQLGAAYKPEATNLQKMGFVFANGGTADPMKETAKNTARTATAVERIAMRYDKNFSASSLEFQNIA